MKFNYQLEKYNGRSSRHTCPHCGRKSFTLYVDTKGEKIDSSVGRCDHESSCGYHLTPKEWFNEHPTERDRFIFDTPIKKIPQQKKTDYIPLALLQGNISLENSLMDFLGKHWKEEELKKVTELYQLGSTADRGIIFPQLDENGRCRTGKIMYYDKEGHRIKGEQDRIDWLHSRLMRKHGKKSFEFNLAQCLFGEHLLSKKKDAIVCIVEGEKTAIICSLIFPAFIWLSCGGKNGLSSERCSALKGRNVILYPDADAVSLWKERTEELRKICHSVKISEWWRDEEEGSRRDIADLIMEERKRILPQPSIENLCGWLDTAGIKKNRVTINI